MPVQEHTPKLHERLPETARAAGHTLGGAIRMPLSMLNPAPWSALLRAGAFGALHGGHPGEPQVGVTVPISTPAQLERVLDTLARHRVHGTLLVSPELGTEAELWQATRAGHEIGGLNLPLNFPRLEALSGQPVRVWGLAGQEQEMSRQTLMRLYQAGIAPLADLKARLEPGAILGIGPDALEGELQRLRTLGYRPVPVRELSDLRRATPRDLFNDLYQRLVEDRYAAQEGIIDLSERFDAVMRIAPLDHAPAPLPLPPHTPTAELHLNSARVVGLASRNLTATYKAYQRSLKDVAHALHTLPELQNAQAVFAVTLFHGPLEKAGFTILDLPPLRARWYGLGFRLLRAAYGTTRAPSEGTPKMGWMSREAFLERYGKNGEGRG